MEIMATIITQRLWEPNIQLNIIIKLITILTGVLKVLNKFLVVVQEIAMVLICMAKAKIIILHSTQIRASMARIFMSQVRALPSK
jgi:hypothetical protein